MGVKGQKLTPREYQELLGKMRSWPDHQRNLVAQLVRHVEWQSEQLKKVSAENSELRQIKLMGELAVRDLPPPPPKPVEPKVYSTLNERIIEAFKKGETKMKYFNLMLSFNGITYEQAHEVYASSLVVQSPEYR